MIRAANNSIGGYYSTNLTRSNLVDLGSAGFLRRPRGGGDPAYIFVFLDSLFRGNDLVVV